MEKLRNKIIPKDKQKLIYVKWQDAFEFSGWLTEEQLEEKITQDMNIIEDVGWVVYENKKELHLVSRRGAWDRKNHNNISEYGLYQRIPRTWILERRVIKYGKA